MKRISRLGIFLLVVLMASVAHGQLVDNGNGTVSDTSTGLTWQQATAPGTYTWQSALSYCENLTLAGRSDWRLPTIKELYSIVDMPRGPTSNYPAINTSFFPNTLTCHYWSSTTYAYYTDYAWRINFYHAGQYAYDKSDDFCVYVRAVRGGQSGPFGNLAGTVVREDRELPISSVRVSVGGQSITTGPDGRYLLKGLAQGTYTVRASHPDYEAKEVSGIQVTASRYFTTALDITMEPVSKTCGVPVVLVRGMGMDIPWDETGQETDVRKSQHLYWKEMREELRSQGFTVWECNEPDPGVLYPEHPEGRWINGEKSVSDNGKWLYNYIKAKIEHECGAGHSPEKINIIAHSMGGLITRHFLKLNENEHVVDVDNVIMLSTPNAGSAMADFGTAASVLGIAAGEWYGNFLERESQWGSLPSRRTTSTSYVHYVYNPNHKWVENTRLYLLAGGFWGLPFDRPPHNPNYSVRTGVEVLKGLSPLGDRKNDSLVTVQSSYGKYFVNNPPLFGSGPPNIGHYVQSFINAEQAQERSEAHLDHDRIRSDPSVLAWVAAILNGSHQLYSNFAPQSTRALAADNENGESQLPTQQVEGLTETLLVPGHSERVVPNDSGQFLSFYAQSTGGDLAFALRTPSGGIIDPASADSDPNIEYELITDPELGSALHTYMIQNPEVGNWAVLYDIDTTPVDVNLVAFGNADLTLTAATDYYVDFGFVPKISCTLFDLVGDTQTSVDGATISATITKPDETTETLTLYDDGLNSDGEANDGVYAAVASSTTQTGDYQVDYRADGTGPGGEVFRRVASSQFAVGTIEDRVVGFFSDEGVDIDFDGISDLVRIQCGITVKEVGTYSISGTLKKRLTGETISGSELFEYLPAGVSMVSIYFDLKDLDAAGRCGEFGLEDLRLFRQMDGQLQWLHTFKGSYTTQDKLKGDFSCDYDVDGSDLAALAAGFGRTDCDSGEPCKGDFDNDGDIDESDLAIFATHYGKGGRP